MLAKLRATTFAVAALVTALPLVVWAQGYDHDHDLARELYEHGQIRSLADILRAVRKHNPGDIVGVELVPVGADWVYRIKIVRADGRRTIVDVDAETAMPIGPDGAQ
jgi:uncharacterized membrane protein YkoI